MHAQRSKQLKKTQLSASAVEPGMEVQTLSGRYLRVRTIEPAGTQATVVRRLEAMLADARACDWANVDFQRYHLQDEVRHLNHVRGDENHLHFTGAQADGKLGHWRVHRDRVVTVRPG